MTHREMLFEKQQGRCALCGCVLHIDKDRHNDGGYLQIDHIKPRSNGGKSVTENIRGVCRSCNSKRLNLSGERLIKSLTEANKKASLKERNADARLADDLKHGLISRDDIISLMVAIKETHKADMNILKNLVVE
jgi:5-methylcytosine-specific restriction endonuclease McrA